MYSMVAEIKYDGDAYLSVAQEILSRFTVSLKRIISDKFLKKREKKSEKKCIILNIANLRNQG